MTVVLGRGECGSHVTLIFTVNDDTPDFNEQGSLGAGLCLNHGVEIIARGIEGDFEINVKFLEGKGNYELYELVTELLSENIHNVKDHKWDLAVKLKLPISQGFGMSAAGAIAAALAIQRAMGEPHEESLRRAFAIAHRVERYRSTGLGDVTALAAGGVERRISPGSPFSGNLLTKGPGISEGWTEDIEVLLAWKEDSGKHTSSYIDNNDWKESISKAGMKQMNCLMDGVWEKTRWSDLLEGAETFAEESGLLLDSKRTELLEQSKNIIDSLGLEYKPLLCMLGKSIVVVPKNINEKKDLTQLDERLHKAGFITQKTIVGSLF
jgi:pantoate kinase